MTTSTASQNIGSAGGIRPSFINSGILRQKQRRKSGIKEKTFTIKRKRNFEGREEWKVLYVLWLPRSLHCIGLYLKLLIDSNAVFCNVSGGIKDRMY